MTKLVKYLSLFAVAALAFTAFDAFAENLGSADNVFEEVADRLITTFKNVRSIIFIIGGFGLVGLGFGAIFGKVNWKWLAALASGLAIVAIAGAVVDYVTQSDANQEMQTNSTFDDTLVQ